MLAVQWGWGQGWPFPSRKNKIFLSHLHFGVWYCIPNLPQTPTGFQHPRNVSLDTEWEAADFVCRILLQIVVGNIIFHGSWSIRSSYFMAVISLLCDLPYLAKGYINSVVWVTSDVIPWQFFPSSLGDVNLKPIRTTLNPLFLLIDCYIHLCLINLEVLTRRIVSYFAYCKSFQTHWGTARENHLDKGKRYWTWILHFQLTFINYCR